MLSKFLDPKNDVAFKKIFGTEKNKDILIHFINDMINFKEDGPIKEVAFLKTLQDPEIAAKKMSMVDILCKDEKGNQYIVEMQVAKEKGFEKRAQYYAAKAYISQAHNGGKYSHLKKVIFLAIANFVMFPNKQDFKSDHRIKDDKTHEIDLKDFSFTFLELPKFQKNIEELDTIVDKWMYFFKHAEETSEQDLHKIIGHDLIIERAYDELNRFSWNEVELLTYDQAEKYEGAYNASMEQKFDEGVAKGKKEGLVEGIEKRNKEIALTMLSKGMDLEIVAMVTGLSKENIKDLHSSLKS
jgi:predicted transposase/invertase (TIGR01784 family)